MAHKTLIDGTAFDIRGGKTLIGGTGYNIKGGKTLVGGTSYGVSFSSWHPVFSYNSWADIILACQTNTVPSTWVADGSCYKNMTINGVEYQIDVIGKNHDTYTAGGIAPLTFQLNKVYGTFYPMNTTQTNIGGYDSTAMHLTHLPTIKTLMPSEVQSGIRPVNKLTSEGGQSATIETISCELFLPSTMEIHGNVGRGYAGEGNQYEYYKTNSQIKVTVSGTFSWERSPTNRDTKSFCCGNITGGPVSAPANNTSCGVAFAFCF